MKLDDLFPYLLPELPGAPDSLVHQQLMLTAIDLCTQSLCWDEIQEAIPVIQNVNELDIDVPKDARIVTVKEIWFGPRRLHPVTMMQLQEAQPDWQTAKGSDPAYYNASADWQTIKIFPIPENPSPNVKMVIRACYAPKHTALTIPDWIVTKYMDALRHGTMSRMMLQHGRSWSNPQLAALYRLQYEDCLVKAKIDVLHDRVQGSLRVQPMPFA